MIPLYGFLEGDTIGLLILADEHAQVSALKEQLERSARVRAAPIEGGVVVHAGKQLDPNQTVVAAGLSALDRFDVVHVGEATAMPGGK